MSPHGRKSGRWTTGSSIWGLTCCFRAHQVFKLIEDDLHELLARRDSLDHLNTRSGLLYLLNEAANDGK